MGTIVGRGITVQYASTLASAISPTAVTKANPGVATLTAHGLTDGAVGYWTVTAGMVELNNQAAHVIATSSSTFTMNGLNTSGYSTYSAGTFTAATAWSTIAEAASYAVGGGAANSLDDTRLYHTRTSNIAGLLAPQDLTIDVRNADVQGAAMSAIEAAAQTSTALLFRVMQGSKTLRVYYGIPSMPGESVQAGALASGQFNILGDGWCVKPNQSAS